MQIKDILLRDPALPIVNEGVANIPEKVGEAELRALRAELEMFVCEGRFKDAIHRLNKDLLACFAAEGIEIPYPTAVEIRKDG